MTTTPAELCVALDGTDRRWIIDAATTLAPVVDWLKIGLEAFVGHGPDLVRDVATHNSKVFLDLKLHDIPATVERAAANAAACGARMVTVHAAGGRRMLEAAVRGAHESTSEHPVLVVAITVLTSLDGTDLAELGIEGPPNDAVLRWAGIARDCGLDGVVASPLEAAALRRVYGGDLLIVTPGVRPAGQGGDDQRRTLGPADAVRAGSNMLVVGRPITRVEAPLEAARRIAREMASV